MNFIKNQRSLSWILFIVLALIWGSAYILIKKGLEAFEPFQVASFRILVASIVLVPLVIGVRKVNLDSKQWFFIILSGFLGSLFPAFLFATAQQELDSAEAGILSSMTPVFTLLVSKFAFDYKIRRYQLPGILLAFIGASLIAINGKDDLNFQWKGVLLVMLATVCYAVNLNFIKYKLSEVPPKLISSLSLIALIIPTAIYLSWTGFFGDILIGENSTAFWSLVILGSTSTGLALLLFIKLLKIANPLFSSSITFAIPFVALAWGIVDGEVLGFYELLSLFMMLLGIWLISKK
ncbi:MAG: DMT family transporter [Saprospiraceae bacterium]|nr:DMT family transporter [Saprospiraceae bacterium]